MTPAALKILIGPVLLMITACDTVHFAPAGISTDGSSVPAGNSTDGSSVIKGETASDSGDARKGETNESHPSPVPESSPSPESDDPGQISLPVPIGGSFLVCSYLPGATINLGCGLEDARDPVPGNISAAFYKVDRNGAEYPLEPASRQGSQLKWHLSETTATVPFRKVKAVFEVGSGSPVILTTELPPVEESFSGSFRHHFVAHNLEGGEPNNSRGTERCVAMNSRSEADGLAAIHNTAPVPNERYNDLTCQQTHRSLCRSLSGTAPVFVISAMPKLFYEARGSCPEGYIFSFPFGPADFELAKSAVEESGEEKIWISVHVPESLPHPVQGGRFVPLGE